MRRRLRPSRTPGGGVVQDARHWWDAVRSLAKSVLADVPPERVVAVACTGQWASTVPVDATGEPVGPCLMWLDTRGAEHARGAIGGPLLGYSPRALATWVRRTAGIPSPFGGDPISHVLHLERDDPRTASTARWYLEPVDYLSMRFTGHAAATFASMSAAWLTDNRRLDRLAYDPLLVRKAKIPADKLPPLVATGSLLGPLRRDVASEIRLREDVQVVTGMPDIHTSALGTGAVDEGMAHTSIGTTSWISLPVARKKTDAIHSIATIPGLDAHGYLVANNQEAAGLCLTWLRDALPGVESLGFDKLLELAASAAPGSGNVIFTPWIAGERSPVDDRNARGGWHNLSVRHQRRPSSCGPCSKASHTTAAGCTHAVERFAHHRLDPLRIFGGGAQSDLWCQIYADVLDVTIERVEHPLHTNLRGATLLAAVALGALRRDEIPQLVRVDRAFAPDPRHRAVYDRLYGEFARLYKAQRRMFARLTAVA